MIYQSTTAGSSSKNATKTCIRVPRSLNTQTSHQKPDSAVPAVKDNIVVHVACAKLAAGNYGVIDCHGYTGRPSRLLNIPEPEKATGSSSRSTVIQRSQNNDKLTHTIAGQSLDNCLVQRADIIRCDNVEFADAEN